MTEQELKDLKDHDLLVQIATHVENMKDGFKECRAHCDTVQGDLYTKIERVRDSVAAVDGSVKTMRAQATLLGTIAGFIVTAVFWVLNRFKI